MSNPGPVTAQSPCPGTPDVWIDRDHLWMDGSVVAMPDFDITRSVGMVQKCRHCGHRRIDLLPVVTQHRE